jgi:hypothetical protein
MARTDDASGDPTAVDGGDRALLAEAIARAVDYRGDVTLELTDGSRIEGFAFDAPSANGTATAIRVLPTDGSDRRTVPIGSIARLAFTGKDAASGKSWENWIRRYAAQKLAGTATGIDSEPV